MKKGVFLVLGEDRFLTRQAVAAAMEGDWDLTRVRGDQTTAAAVLDELKTRSLFGGPRAVVVEEAGALLEGESLQAIAAYAAAPVPGTRLVLQVKKIDGRLKASKALKEAARVIECKPLPDNQVPGWIAQRAREAYGLTMNAQAANTLRDRIGEDLGLLDNALARLRDQVAGKDSIDTDDITASTDEHRSPILFEAANALQAADLPGALESVRKAFADGIRIRQDVVTDPQGIALILLSNLHGAYRNLLRFQMSGGDASKLQMPPGAAYHLARKASRHPLQRLVDRHVHFLEADVALKRSQDEPRRILEHLILSLLQESSVVAAGS